MAYYNKHDSITFDQRGRYDTGTIKEVDENKMIITLTDGREVKYGQVCYHNGPAEMDERFAQFGISFPKQ